jgi:protein disulfide-isomerase
MRTLILFCIAAVLTTASFCPAASPSAADDTGPAAIWGEHYDRALEQARTEHKLVLLDFTGSDWCIWCHRLDEQILSKPFFLDYAREHLVLVTIDFPQNKSQLPETVRQNATLSEKFSVTGYPTIVLVDAEGRELGRTGYMQGGPKTFVRELEQLATKAADVAPTTPPPASAPAAPHSPSTT